jgi:hypothetical protein
MRRANCSGHGIHSIAEFTQATRPSVTDDRERIFAIRQQKPRSQIYCDVGSTVYLTCIHGNVRLSLTAINTK